ncbi:MAG: YhdP family protein [Pseudomonadota bacterium]
MRKLGIAVIHFVWRLLLALIVMLAIFVTIMHFVTPQINKYPDVVTNKIRQYTGLEIHIGQLNAQWNGIKPVIHASNVDIDLPQSAHQSKNKTWLHVNQISIALNLWTALLHLSLYPTEMHIDGVKLSIKQASHHHININGMTITWQSPNNKPSAIKTKIINILQQATLVSAQHVDLNLTPLQGNAHDLLIPNVQLSNFWHNHHLLARLEVRQATDRSAIIIARANGNLNNLQHIQAKLYLKLQHIALENWIDKPIDQHFKIKQSIVNGQIWLNRAPGKWLNSQATVNATDLQLLETIKNRQLPTINTLKGNFLWQPTPHGWQLSSPNLALTIDKNSWPKVDISFSKIKQQQQIKLSYVNVGDMTSALLASNWLPDKAEDILSETQPTGTIDNISLSYHGSISHDNINNLSADLNQINVKNYHNLPGLTNLSGKLQLTKNNLDFSLNSRQASFTLPALFKTALPIDHASATIHGIKQSNGSWKITAKSFNLSNKILAFYGNAALLLPQDKLPPTISIIAGFHHKNAALLSPYFPENHFPQGLSDWLNKAFLSSDADNGMFVVYGNPYKFHFSDGGGLFWASKSVKNLTLNYGPDWPILKHLNGQITLYNNSLIAKVTSGKIYNSTITHADAYIPNIHTQGSPHIYITGEINSNGKDINTLVHQSPVADILKDKAKPLNARGNFAINLTLDVPLEQTENTKLSGLATFKNAGLQISNLNLDFTQLAGALAFTENSITASDITGKWLGYPGQANINTTKDEVIQINAQGELSVIALENYLQWPKNSFISGVTKYNAAVNLYANAQDQRLNTLNVESDLEGIKIDYPTPFNKTTQEPKPATLKMQFGEGKDTTLNVNYNNLFSVASLFKDDNNDQAQMYSTHINFGSSNTTFQSQPGIVVSGYIPKLNWSNWSNYINNMQKNNDNISPSSLQPNLINVTVGELDIADEKLDNTNVKITPADDQYDIKVSGNQIVGSFRLPKDLVHGLFSGDLQRLQLPNATIFSEDKNEKASLKFDQIPSTFFSVNNINIGPYFFNHLTVSTSKNENDLVLNQFNVQSEILTGNVSGNWYFVDDNKQQTTLSGNLYSQNLIELMTLLKSENRSLEATRGGMTFNLTWNSSPNHFDATTATGNIRLQLYNGYFDNLNQRTDNELGLGKVVTILSLDNILSGFSSLKHKGYTFKTMTGLFKFNKGMVTLDSVEFKGSVADIDLSGNVNTIKKTLDLGLFIKPHISSSIPIIVGAATLNPIIGAVAWIGNRIFGAGISRVAGSHYTITGTFDHPKIEKVNSSTSKK